MALISKCCSDEAEKVRPKSFDLDVRSMLRTIGMRPTRQRTELGRLLFSRGNRHLTAEMLAEEAFQSATFVSLATVYNTLNRFTEAGLLRQIAVDGSKTYFDTNTAQHHHLFLEDQNLLIDMPVVDIRFSNGTNLPENHEIARVDVVVRLKRRRS